MSEVSSGEVQNTSAERLTRQTLEVNSRTVEVIKVTPDTIKINSRTGKPVNPVFFEYGYGKVGVETLDWYLKALAREGREAIGITYQPLSESGTVPIGSHGKAAVIDQERAKDQLAVMDQLGIDIADVIAESGGVPRALVAAQLDPNKFENILLVHPAGVDNNGYLFTHLNVVDHQLNSVLNPRMLLERIKRWKRRQSHHEEPSSSSQEDKLQWAKRTRAEQKAVAHANLASLIPEVQESNPAIRVAIIADKNDYHFRYRRLQKVNRNHLFEFVTSRWRGHGIGYSQERVAEIGQTLTRMEASPRHQR